MTIINYNPNVLLSGTSGNDIIRSYYNGYNVTINAGAGNDSILNHGDSVTIDASNGNDSINNHGEYVTITSDVGNDYIVNYGSKVTINGNSGNDEIFNNCYRQSDGSIYYQSYDDGLNVVFNYKSGDGNDKIYGFRADSTLSIGSGAYSSTKSGDNVIVTVGDGKILLMGAASLSSVNIVEKTNSVVIKNTKSNTLLSGTKGNDSIQNGGLWDVDHDGGSNVTINADAGNDEIDNYGSNVTINSGVDNDFIDNYGIQNVLINGGMGKDFIQNFGFMVTINSGAGDDSVYNRAGSHMVINLGDGNDTIKNYCANVSIYSGKGNDSIYNEGTDASLQYTKGDGNDIIYGFKADSTLSISSGAYSSTKSGDNVIVTVGDGKISLMGASSLSAVNIKGKKSTSTTLTVTNSTKSPVTVGSAIKTINASTRTKASKIIGNSLANTITGGSGKDTILGGAGNDKLYGGNGNDSLLGGNGKDTLSGGAGNDKLYGGKGNDCLVGGKGNDSLWGEAGADTFIYGKGDGKDVIFGFGSDDTLMLDNLTFTSSCKNDVLTLSVDGGSITFKDFTTKTFHINGSTYKLSGGKLK